MKRTLIWTLVFAAFSVAPVTAQEWSEDQQAVIQTLIDMWAAIEEGDVDRYATYIHPDFTAFGEGVALFEVIVWMESSNS